MEGAMRWVIAALLIVTLVAPVGAQSSAPPFAAEAVDAAVVLVSVVTESSSGRAARGSGSGVILEPDGLILTANHVVSRARQIDVTLAGGETYRARIVGTDPVFDSALIRIDAPMLLPTAALGDSAELQSGSLVTALGRSPRRRSGPTTGIVIARDLEARPGIPHVRSTAVVWPGDSGGALVNDRGEIVGLIVAITRDGTVSLSVASEAIRRHFEDLRAGFVRHAWLGVTGITVTPEVALELGVAPGGVLITDVVEGGPAALAGLRGGRPLGARDLPRGGDVIVAIDGRPVPTFGALAAYVLGRRIGDPVTLEFLRDGATFTTTVVLGERPGI